MQLRKVDLMAKDDITKTRKKLTKLIRKFNKGQVEYVAVGKHADNTDIVMIIDSWGADSLRHILTIRPGGIYSTDKSTFKINDNLLEFMTNSYVISCFVCGKRKYGNDYRQAVKPVRPKPLP